jgi:hypothetical protein
VTRRDARAAAELVFRTFRRQHLEKFLPGLDKLGLRGLPDAVSAPGADAPPASRARSGAACVTVI